MLKKNPQKNINKNQEKDDKNSRKKMQVVVRLLLFFFVTSSLIVSCGTQNEDVSGRTGGSSVSLLPGTISRVNWGLLFNKVNAVINGYSKYRHTFAVQIPTIGHIALPKLRCGAISSNSTSDEALRYITLDRDLCAETNTFIDSVNEASSASVNAMNERVSSWINDLPDIDETPQSLSKRKRKRKKRAVTLGPSFCQNIDEELKDNQGTGLFSSVGKLFTSLLGSPTWSDVKITDKHICELANATRLVHQELVKSSQRLSSISKSFNLRLDNIEKSLTTIARGVNETQDYLVRLASVEFEDVNKELDFLNRTARASHVRLILTQRLLEVEALLSETESIVTSFGIGLSTLAEGKLPFEFVSPSDLTEIIQQIKTIVEDENGMRLIHSDPMFYYLSEDIVYTKSTKLNAVVVTVNVPFYSDGGLLAAYRIDKIFLATDNDANSSTRIENIPDFFLTTGDERYYLEMSVAEFAGCKGSTLKTCKAERSLQEFTSLSCAAAVYKDDAKTVMQACDFRWETKIQPSIAVQLTDNNFLIHSIKSVTKTAGVWTVSCPLHENVEIRETQHTVQPCNSCIMQVPCGCQMNAPGEFVIPLQLSACPPALRDDGSLSIVKTFYPVNLAVLHSVFTPDQLKALNGRDPVQEWTLQIPKFDAFSFDWNRTVEVDRQYSKDLRKLINQTIYKREIFATKADAFLKKGLDRSEFARARLKNIETSIVDLATLKWLNPNATIAGISVSAILAGVALFMSIYNCYMAS